MTATHTFTLPSGIECEVREFTGKEQEILTMENKKTHVEKLNDLLMSIVVRVGSVNTLDKNFMDGMLEVDKRFILVEARQFTMSFDPDFVFNYKYTDHDGNKQVLELKETIPDGHFPMKRMQILNPEYNEKTIGTEEETPKYIDANYSEYSEIEKYCYLVLPKSNQRIRWSQLDTKGNLILQSIGKNNRSSHTPIEMRNPVYFEGDTPIKLNLNRLHMLDVEAIRKDIREKEGRIDTEISFEHPDAEYKGANEKTVILDVLSTVAFFFPSEAI